MTRNLNEKDTSAASYSERLQKFEKSWKRILRAHYPYMKSIQKQKLGKSLDIGCGIGRVLTWLPEGSVGIDHNETSINLCKTRGLTAFTVLEFHEAVSRKEIDYGSFDSLVMTHLLEHLEIDQQKSIFEEYLRYLKPGGKIFIVTPQEMGFKSDHTHITFTDLTATKKLLEVFGIKIISQQSFPLPRFFGRIFKYNEFHTLGISNTTKNQIYPVI
jgi:2-polyprenyl-3-methyl-5-hydroxy-6-metoxy-1,4-benzoquinol methylase